MKKNIEFIDFYINELDSNTTEKLVAKEKRAIHSLDFIKEYVKVPVMTEFLCEYIESSIETELDVEEIVKVRCESVELVDNIISIVFWYDGAESHDRLREKVRSIKERLPHPIKDKTVLTHVYDEK